MAEQTLTINTLAATVITPSDVSQFSLDDIAPNIINGGGGTIVDVSGIVTLASQVAELDSEVTVLQTNVSDLQEDVSGLDAAVAQAQTTATSAASTANAAVATANSAKSTAQYALKAGTAQYTLKSSTAQYALKAGTAQYALEATETLMASRATALQYYRTDTGQFGDLEAKVNAGQLTFSDLQGNELSVAGSSSGGDGFNGVFYDTAPIHLTSYEEGHAERHFGRLELASDGAALTGLHIGLYAPNSAGSSLTIDPFPEVSIHGVTARGIAEAISPYMSGGSGGGGFNGSFTGAVDLSSGGNVSLQLNSSTASLLGGDVTVGYRYDGSQISFDSHGIGIGNPEVGRGTTLQIYQFNKVSIHPFTAQGIASEIESYLTGGSGGGSSSGGPVSELTFDGKAFISVEDGTALFYVGTDKIYVNGYKGPGNATLLRDAILEYVDSSSGGDGTATSLTYKGADLVTVADGSVEFSENAEQIIINSKSRGTSLKETILLYAGSGGGSSSGGGGFDGSYSGNTLDLTGTDTVKISSKSSMITLDSYPPNEGPTGSVDGVLAARAYSEMWLLAGGGANSTYGRVLIGARNYNDGNGYLSAVIALESHSELAPNSGGRVFIGSGQDVVNGEAGDKHGIAVGAGLDYSTFQVYTDKIAFGTDATEIYISRRDGSEVSVLTLKDTILMYAGSGGGGSATAQFTEAEAQNLRLISGILDVYDGGDGFTLDGGTSTSYLQVGTGGLSVTRKGTSLAKFGDGVTLYDTTFYGDANDILIKGGAGPSGVVSLKDTILMYAGSGGGSSSGGDVSELSYQGDTVISVESGEPVFYTSPGRITFVEGSAINSLTDIINESSASTLRYYASPEYHTLEDGEAGLVIDNISKTFKFCTRNGTILAETEGGSSSSGYPALMQGGSTTSLYYGITSPDSTVGLKFGTFGNEDGTNPKATVQAFGNTIDIECYDNGSTILTYGLWVKPGNLRFGVASTENIDGLTQGVYIPSSPGYNDAPMYVGSRGTDSETKQVYGLAARNSNVGVGNTWYDSSADKLGVATGLLVDTHSTLAQAWSSDGEASLLLDASGSIATLSAIFTLRNDTTIIGPTDWAKLKQLADNADALLALLNK
jgi:hypothetical protein